MPFDKVAYAKLYAERNRERIRAYQKEYHAKNKELRNSKTRLYNSARRKNSPEVYIWSRFKNKSKKLGIPFNLDVSDIKIPTHCPILGTELQFNLGGGKMLPNSPSLDKLIPELGYVKGNVWIISTRANLMKQDASLEELKRFGQWARKASIR